MSKRKNHSPEFKAKVALDAHSSAPLCCCFVQLLRMQALEGV